MMYENHRIKNEGHHVGSKAKQDDPNVPSCRSLELLSKPKTLSLRLKHLGPSVTLFFPDSPLKIVRGRGQYLFDERGRKYLDCINNVAHVGHGNEHVARQVGRQLELLNTNSRFLHDNLSMYARRLCSQFPAHLSVCYLVNSGSEANDLAIRLARSYTGRKDIVSLEGAYHGNLTSTMAISPYKTRKLHNFRQPKWAHVAPLPDEYRGLYRRDEHGADSTGKLYAEAAIRVMEEAGERGRQVAAFFVESMVSCGGQMPLPESYLAHLQTYLHSNGSLLVCDEVQTGFGRTGKKMWAFQLGGEQVRPDIVTIGKPMGNGFPCSAVVTTPEVAEAFKEIGTEYFNTFGGNPASCAAAMAVLDELESRCLMREADLIGNWMLAEIDNLREMSTTLGDVRGHGFFIGMEMVESKSSRRPSKAFANFIVRKFRDSNILMSTEGDQGNVLKFKPPMVFGWEDARQFVAVLADGLNQLDRSLATDGDIQDTTLSRAQSRLDPASSTPSSRASVSSNSSWFDSSYEA